MRIDDENKVVVPDYVAEWIEYNINQGVSLEIMMGCYRSFLNSEEERITEGSKAVEWFVKNPYEFVKAYVEGFKVEVSEPDKKYYWRKKKEYLASFEDEQYLFAGEHEKTTVTSIAYASKFDETELMNVIGSVDFDKFEKVECE